MPLIDPVSLLLGLILPFWWVLPLLLAFAWLQSPTGKGWFGEALLHLVLRLALPRAHYHLRRNVTLPTADGTTQIDHVVISRHGIFVIETKNYAGWIFGKVSDKTWTQKFPRRSHTFQNPLRQNYKHVRTLAELTDADENALFSLIVFVGAATFKTPMPPNVTQVSGCLDFIRARTATLLDDAEVARLVAAIDHGRVAPSRRADAAHVAHVRARRAGQAGRSAAPPADTHVPANAGTVSSPPPPPPLPPQAEAEAAGTARPIRAPLRPVCPRCGSAVGEYRYRTGDKAGQAFHGCSQFPACTYRADLPA